MNKEKIKHVILCICFLYSGLGMTIAQKVKYKSITLPEKLVLPGVQDYLQPTQTFAVKIPEQLEFYQKDKKGGNVMTSPMIYQAKIKAALTQGDELADYTFKIATPGICILDSLLPKKSSSGYLGEINYTFPGSLEVYNKDGKVIRQYILQDKNTMLHTTYHSAFLAPQPQPSMSIPDKPSIVGFSTEAILLQTFRKNKNDIYAHIETIELNKLIEIAQEIMAFGYGSYVWPYKCTYMELDKKAQPVYPELTLLIKEYAQTFTAYIADPGNETYRTKFAEYGNAFTALLNEQTPEGVTTCCAFNAICCYCMAEYLPQADSLFRKYKKFFGFFVYPRLDDFGYGYCARQTMRNTDEVVYYTKPLSFSGRIQMEQKLQQELERATRDEAYRAELERLDKRNIKKEEGYVIDENGNKYEGKLDAQFTEPKASGIVNTSLGKHVMVYPQEGKVRGFGPAKIQYFVADNIYFFPLKEYNPGIIKALGVLEGSMSRMFYERIYETEHYTLYYDRTATTKEDYLIAKKGSEEAVSFTWIQVLNKNALAKLEVCTALQERIKSKEFVKDNVDSIKSFLEALEKCQ